jgi:hypothetical protein
MTHTSISDAAKAVVRRNTEEVQGRGNFELFEELFADDFLDHTPQPAARPIRPAHATSIAGCVRRFRIFVRRSTGSARTAMS